MASEVFVTEEVKLRDGTEVLLRPLAIFDLRRFMKRWTEFTTFLQENREKEESEQASESDIGDAQFDCFTDLCVISLEEPLKGNKSDDEYRRYIEKTLDEATIYKVLFRCGGLKLDAPNQETASLAVQDGTN